jgi:hypothetical protein
MMRLVCLTIAACLWTGSARAYVDGTPTLGRIVGDASAVAVVQVDKVDHENEDSGKLKLSRGP